jgi:hypothetical protein
MRELVAMYKNGAITAHHLAVECLHMLDPSDPCLVLSALPKEILQEIEDFAKTYRPERMVTNYGVIPAPDQVDAAIEWIRKGPESLAHEKQHAR